MNAAFENDSQPRDIDDNNSISNGIPTNTAADEKRNVVFIVIIH